MEESAKSKNRKLTFVSNISFSNQVDLNSKENFDPWRHYILEKKEKRGERGGGRERKKERERMNE